MFLGCPQMNNFEQISSDHHQMSLAEGGVPGLMSDVLEGARGLGVPGLTSRVGLYSEVQCIMGNGHMASPPVDTQTHL